MQESRKKSPEQDRISALTAQLVQLKGQQKKAGKKTWKKKGNDVANTRNNQPNSNPGTKGQGKENKKKKEVPAWKKVPPTDAEKAAGSKKFVNGHWYHWCYKHMMWTFHKPEDCKGVGWRPGKENVNVQETVVAPYERQE